MSRDRFPTTRGRRAPRPAARQRAHRPDLEAMEGRLLMAAGVLTYRYDQAADGVDSAERALSPNNVKVGTPQTGSFGKLYAATLDGAVYAQPLVVPSTTIASGVNTTAGAAGTHDVVLVATEHDSVYAIDAQGGAILWKRSFLDPSNPGGDTNNTLGATAISTLTSGDVNSGDLSEVGITGTPVVDTANGVAYVVAKTKETVGGATYFVQRIHAVSLADGTDKVAPDLIGSTTNGNTNATQIYAYGSGDGTVTDPYNGTGKPVVQFNALRENERGSLALVNGTLYIDWASHGDNRPYHGWVATWDVSKLTTAGFRLDGVFNTSPNTSENGIWQGGGALSFDSSGAFYFEVGNGAGGHGPLTLNAAGFPADGSYYDAVIKMVADPTTGPASQGPNGWGLKVADYFVPTNNVALDNADQDLGSGAPLVLPDSAGIPGHPHLLVAGGKQGVIYVIDRDNMGKFNAGADQVVSEQNVVGGDLGTPSYFNGKLYYEGDYSSNVRSFTVATNGTLASASQTNPGVNLGYLPGSPTISANGTTGGILWALDRNANLLHAYDASALSTELWNSGQAANSVDALGASVKFGVPTVANGEAFVGTASNTLVAYGLEPPPSQAPAAPSGLAATPLSSTSIRLSWTDNSSGPTVATGFLIEEATGTGAFAQVTTAPGGTTSIDIGGLSASTAYSFRVRAYDGAGDSGYSNVAQATTGAGTPTAPLTPTGLGAAPATATSVTLSWTNSSTNQAGFQLDRALDPGFTQGFITESLPATPSTYTDTAQGLAPGTTYYYRLRATNAAGASGNSNVAIVSIPVAPPKATNAAVAKVTTSEIDLTWTDNAGRAATGYLIERQVNGGTFANYAYLPASNATPPSTYTWNDTGLTPGTAYEYHILAYNTSGNNDFVGANAETITLSPSGLTATPGPGRVALSWTAPAGAVSYNVYRGTASGKEALLQAGVTATTFLDTTGVAGTTYYYDVTAVNANTGRTPALPAESAASKEASAAPAIGSTPVVNFPNGFATGTAGVLTFNGGAAVAGGNLQLTDGGGNEARSVFTTSPVAVTRFTTTFTFRIAPGASTADGFTFTIQGAGATALGGTGGGLGYGTDGANAGATIGKSLAVKFDLYNNQGEGTDSTGVSTNGASPTNVGSIDLTGTIDLHSGDILKATIGYDGSNLTETIADATTGKTFTHTYSGTNIPALVGGATAYVGFTAGTGGQTATQAVQSWTFAPIATQVNLSGAYNETGIYADGTTFTGGVGGSGAALSGTLLGTGQAWNGNTYALGAAGAPDLIRALGQAVALPQGNYSSLSFLAFANGGSFGGLTFTVTYADGTTQTFTQGVSDWHNPQGYAGESKAVPMAYKDLANGTKVNLSSTNAPYYLYGYTVALNGTKAVKSITLPNQGVVNLAAIDLI